MSQRDKYTALMAGYEALKAQGPTDCTFVAFVVGVGAYVKRLTEDSLDRQYAYERALAGETLRVVRD